MLSTSPVGSRPGSLSELLYQGPGLLLLCETRDERRIGAEGKASSYGTRSGGHAGGGKLPGSGAGVDTAPHDWGVGVVRIRCLRNLLVLLRKRWEVDDG